MSAATTGTVLLDDSSRRCLTRRMAPVSGLVVGDLYAEMRVEKSEGYSNLADVRERLVGLAAEAQLCLSARSRERLGHVGDVLVSAGGNERPGDASSTPPVGARSGPVVFWHDPLTWPCEVRPAS